MKKQWILVIAGIALVLALPIYSLIQFAVSVDRNPRSVQGWLDLREWNFRKDGEVRLTGEWEFYRNQLLTPDDFAAAAGTGGQKPELTGIMHLPGKWDDYIAEEGQPSSAGYATYRLRIMLGEGEDAIYGIRTTNIRSANRVFMNGKEAGASGDPGISAGQGKSGNVPYVAFASIPGGQVEIIVQVANYIYSPGGFFYPMLFGDQKSIMDSREEALFGDWVTAAGFLIPCIYFLVLHRLRRKETALLYLGLFCCAALVYVLTHGEKLMAGLIPGMNYETFTRIQTISSVYVYYFLLRYVMVIVPLSYSGIALALSRIMAAGTIIIAVGFPVIWISKFVPYVAISVVTIGYVVAAMWKGMRSRSEDSLLMLLSMLSIVVMIVVYLVDLLVVFEDQILIPFEMLLFVTTQALLLAKRFANSFVQVEQLSQRLLTLDGLKDEFMANTSHELRTPLHGMINISQSLLEGAAGKLNEKMSSDLALVVSTGKRLSLLVNDILDFAKLRNGQITLRRQYVDLKAVSQSVLEVVGHLATPKKIRFVQQWPEELPGLHTDEDRLRQILYNLFGNAIKFTRQGEIRISAAAEDGHVRISVADTGVGIEPERMADIFKAFDQTDPVESDTASRGTGLGLSISKKLVELGGGRIWAESEPGRGSVFHFTLPAASDGPPVTPESRKPVPGGESPAEVFRQTAASAAERGTRQEGRETVSTVLLVDDDPVNLQVLINLLALENYEVIAVDNGREALDIVTSGRPVDLVLADWMMPEMSGLELSRAIRSRYSLSELPVLMLTARRLPEDVRVGFQAGVNDFLGKPVDADELRARVHTLLAMRNSVRSAVLSELAFLQAQIKPHFLYNALNTIIAFCPSDPELATRLLVELSNYLRASFDFRNREQLTPLHKEVALIQSYVSLEKARFDKRLKVEYEIDNDSLAMIPPLTIQPIVENAIRHGVMQKASGGTVLVKVKNTGSAISVTVEDDGVGMTEERLASVLAGELSEGGVGIRNIHGRLLTLYGQGLRIETEWKRGTRVSFEVPKSLPAAWRKRNRGENADESHFDRR
ncbi:ATP-binding protein [Paenibacillus sp. GCM10012303]|uniref:ATP-binding protein n=1 Tax=Paenibacillus sp. GCM10012303 TaxID=3317340 RepID=UPI003619AC7C